MVTLPLTQQNIIYCQLHKFTIDMISRLSLKFQLTRVANLVLVITELNCDLRPRFQSSSNMVSYKLWMKNERYLSNKWNNSSTEKPRALFLFVLIVSFCPAQVETQYRKVYVVLTRPVFPAFLHIS